MADFKKHPYLNIEVSDEGIVHRPERRSSRQIVRKDYVGPGHINSEGYYVIGIDGKYYKVHRLVAETWIGECPTGCTVDHIDRNRLNNRADNLRYATPHEQCINSKTHLLRDTRITVSQSEDPNGYRRQYNSLNRERVRAYQRSWCAKRRVEK